jgi:cobalt-zinc-cadmium efflux system membrane fusion protein
MNKLRAISSSTLSLSLAVAVCVGAWWLVKTKSDAAKPDKPAPAASVTKVVKEDELNTVTLTAEAETRLGVATAAVEKKNVRRVRVYGAEVIVPIGRSILVAAPLGGTLKAPAGGELRAGQAVKAGQPVFQLFPLLTPDGRATMSASLADSDGQVKNAHAQLDLARIALDRAKRVLKEGAGSQRQVDEAQAAFSVASRTLDAATARLGVLKKVIGDAEAGTVAPLSIDAPSDGILRTVSATSNQTVPSGAALFEVTDLSTVWVRVPLPVNDLDGIDRAEPARVGKLSAPAGTALAAAQPVLAPPSANPLAATVDVYYELPNPGGKLTPGQRVGATLSLADKTEGTAVPWSAVIFDVNGGTWVYEQVGDRKYARRRVVVKYTSGTDAVLESGPAAGAKVVTAGCQELFGAETGFSK